MLFLYLYQTKNKIILSLESKNTLPGKKAAMCRCFQYSFFQEQERKLMLIMIILFHRRLPAYLFSLLIMLFLRCSTGGLHFYTYAGCLLASITYIYFAIFILPNLLLLAFMQLLLLLLCVVVCYHIGPVVSKYRAKPSQTLFTRGRNTTCTFIFIYALILYIMPANHLMNVGFWVIILHSLQLIIAKIIGNCETSRQS